MQKNKILILRCLVNQGMSTRFQIRSYIQATTTATNSSEIIRNLQILEEAGCIKAKETYYDVTEKGKELLDLLNRVTEILK